MTNLIASVKTWLEKRFDFKGESYPVMTQFANVILCAYRAYTPIDWKGTYFNGSIWGYEGFHRIFLTPCDTEKRTLRMQAQETIPMLAWIRLFGCYVPWIDNVAWIDGHCLTRVQRISQKTGNAYTVGYSTNDLTFLRLRDCLDYLEQTCYTYKRGKWIVR